MTGKMEDGTQTLVGEKTPEELLRELEQAQQSEDNRKAESEMEASLERGAKREMEILTGKDIPFDPVAFIKFGVIRKENLTVVDGIVVDMESLTQQRRAFAEKMVKSFLGESVQDTSYKTLLDTALLAMAITRINSREFPSPNLLDMGSEASKKAVVGKGELFKLLLDSIPQMIDTLTTIYNGLEAADVLVADKEPVIKK